jgi:creatinine amidohydrolase
VAARDIICPFPALSHLGNFNAFLAILPRVREAFGVSTQVFAYTDPQAWLLEWRSAVERAGGDPESLGGHTDIAETSLVIHLRPDTVRHEKLVAGHVGLMTTVQLNMRLKMGLPQPLRTAFGAMHEDRRAR